jgi:protein TonB
MSELPIKRPVGTMRRLARGVTLIGFLSIGSPTTAEGDAYIVRQIWIRRPSAADLERFYPKGAGAVTADVRADCTVDDNSAFKTCEIVSEDQPGKGFGQNTTRLPRLFRMRAIDGDGAPVAGRKVRLPVRWRAQFSQ